METQVRDQILRCPICGQRFKHRLQKTGTTVRCRQCHERIGVVEGECLPQEHDVEYGGEKRPQTTCQPEVLIHCGNRPRPTVLLLEHRDEIVARLATDLAEAGLTIIRPLSVSSALRACSRRWFDMVITTVDPPHDDGWRFAQRLRIRQPTMCLWLYQSHKTATDVSRANTLGAAELIEYRGDLLDLSEMVLDCLVGRLPRRTNTRCKRWQNRCAVAAA